MPYKKKCVVWFFFCFFLFHVLILRVSPYMTQGSLELFNLTLSMLRLQAWTTNPADFSIFCCNLQSICMLRNTPPFHLTHSQYYNCQSSLSACKEGRAAKLRRKNQIGRSIATRGKKEWIKTNYLITLLTFKIIKFGI